MTFADSFMYLTEVFHHSKNEISAEVETVEGSGSPYLWTVGDGIRRGRPTFKSAIAVNRLRLYFCSHNLAISCESIDAV